jgi:hypothetical protein
VSGACDDEDRNALIFHTTLKQATGAAERDAAAEMARRIPGGSQRVTLGADKAYDTRGFVGELRELNVPLHVAQNTTNRPSGMDTGATGHEGYAVSQRKHKRVEEVLGRLKTVASMRKTRYRGPDRVGWMVTFAAAAHNPVRMRNLAATA